MTPDQLDSIIVNNFDDNDRDIGTSGLCGMFALALYSTLLHQNIVSEIILVCAAEDNGSVAFSKKPILPHWNHVLIKWENKYFDIEGEVQLSHAMNNYVWSGPATTMPVNFEECTRILRKTKSSVDRRYLLKWKKKLESGLSSLSPS